MNRHENDDLERLRTAFSAVDAPTSQDRGDDHDRIWRAVRGELEPNEVAELADRAGRSPETAQAWRLALEMSRRLDRSTPDLVIPIKRRRPLRRITGLAAAAIVVVGLAAVLYRAVTPAPAPVYRTVGETEIVSLLAPGAALPRDDFVLRWAAMEDATYEIVVTDASLAIVDQAAYLENAEYRIPETALALLAAGAEVWWTVEATTPEGRRVVSPTFVARVR